MCQEPCPICCYKPVKHHFEGMDSASNRDFYSIDCPRCGKFEISGTFKQFIKNKKLSSAQVGLLSGHIRDANLNHQQLTLDEYNTDTNENHFEKWLSQLSKTTTEKQNKLLIALKKQIPEPGETIIISLDTDISLAWAASQKELKFHLKGLHEREFINLYSSGNEELDDFTGRKVKILGKGWGYLDSLPLEIDTKSKVFVAMKFGSRCLDNIYDEFIHTAIEETGYDPYRVDRDVKNMERIDKKIIDEIRNSRFMVADATGQRPSVYYEAGLAQSLGLPVIWTVKESQLKKIPFDTRQLPHQTWKNGKQLKEKLTKIILAQIGPHIIHNN